MVPRFRSILRCSSGILNECSSIVKVTISKAYTTIYSAVASEANAHVLINGYTFTKVHVISLRLSVKDSVLCGNLRIVIKDNIFAEELVCKTIVHIGEVVVICAKIEAELAELDDEERDMFLEDMGITESGLDKLIKSSYALLDLISFLTTGEDETRAWTIKRGTLAPQAAGKIHTDFEKGFIRAETIAYDKLMEVGGKISAAKERGWLRSEGKDYEVKDGDVVHFLFNV